LGAATMNKNNSVCVAPPNEAKGSTATQVSAFYFKNHYFHFQKLKEVLFGSCNIPPPVEWLKQGLVIFCYYLQNAPSSFLLRDFT